MAPNKFDENIKESLEARNIEPSSKAWSKLSKRLDAQDTKNSKSIFWFVGIAASMVGVILVSTFLFNEDSVQDNVVPIVEMKKNIDMDQNQVRQLPKSNAVANVQDEASPIETQHKNTVKKETVKKDVTLMSKETIASKDRLASNVEQSTNTEQLNEPASTSSEKHLQPLEALKVEEVVAEITKLKTDNANVTDREIDSLLKQAERELFVDKTIRNDSKVVSADALLKGVEHELERSFRDKVFEALKTSYESVKTAVADRNN